MRLLLLTLLLVACRTVQAAAPDEAFDTPQVVAVEPRAYNPHYDITGQFSILPLDAFYKGIGFGVSYTHTYGSSWGWEVVNAHTVSPNDTNLKKDLINNFNVQPIKGILDNIKTYITSNAVYTPIYSKNLLFNSSLLYGSFSFVFGGGIVAFSNGDSSPMYGGGGILRAFHSPSLSSKFDFRLYMHTAPNKSSDMILTLTYGLSFELGDNKPWF